MSFFGWGSNGIESTTKGVQSGIDTASLLAEVDLNGSNATCREGGQTWGVTWIVGCGNTSATFLLDHALSTGVATTGVRNQTVAQLTSNASAQFFTKHAAFPGDRFRVRVASTGTAGITANAKVIAEPLV